MKRILGRDLYHIFEYVKEKKIILYGSGRCAADVIQKLKCLDLDVAYCVDDNFDNIVVEKPVHNIYELLLEKEPFYVFIVKNDIQQSTYVLKGLGLEYLDNYCAFFLAAGKMTLENTFALDPLLGYSMPYEETQGRGVKIYGDLNTAEHTIAILGGSTSDPCAYPWKSWGEFLYEKGRSEGKEMAVIVGAVCGYSSSEEFLKLIRDILPLKPGMVISYSGVNDKVGAQSYVNGYQRTLYERLASLQQGGIYGLGEANSVCWGVSEHIQSWQKWIRNQKMMYLLAKENRMDYVAFLQPTVISKKRGEKDEAIYLYIEEGEIANETRHYKKIRQLIERGELEYVVDATGWFDATDGFFYDYCHVFEEGNQLIAQKVYEYIFGRET